MNGSYRDMLVGSTPGRPGKALCRTGPVAAAYISHPSLLAPHQPVAAFLEETGHAGQDVVETPNWCGRTEVIGIRNALADPRSLLGALSSQAEVRSATGEWRCSSIDRHAGSLGGMCGPSAVRRRGTSQANVEYHTACSLAPHDTRTSARFDSSSDTDPKRNTEERKAKWFTSGPYVPQAPSIRRLALAWNHLAWTQRSSAST